MNPSTRHSLAMALIGILASVAGLWIATFLRQDACLDSGGKWDAARQFCALPEGAAASAMLSGPRFYGVAVLAAVVIAAVLWRMFTFGRSRARARGSA